VAEGCGGGAERQGPGNGRTGYHDDGGGGGVGDRVQQGQDQVSKFSLRHLTDRSSSLSISLFLLESLIEQC
jgi:hypothetical protein